MTEVSPDATRVDAARLVFVGGLHRSGTTPLARILAAHPEITGLTETGAPEDEGAHLQDVFPKPREFGGMGRFATKDAAHLTAASPLVSPVNAQRLVDTWLPFWDADRRLLLEKSPGNLIMGGYLQAMFPGSALIVVVRHPVAVALAMQKWNPWPMERNGRRFYVTMRGYMRNWMRAHELLESDAAGLRRLHVLRYEDLITDPDTRLAAVARFLELDSPVDAAGVQRGRSDGYQQQWDDWAAGNPLRRRARRMVEREYGAAMARWGYDPTVVTRAVGPGEVPILDC